MSTERDAALNEALGILSTFWDTDGAIAEAMKQITARKSTDEPTPIDMVLYCPKCHVQHVDREQTANECNNAIGWSNPPHRSHLCHNCGFIWRPADVPTNGVVAIKTKGKNDSEGSAA